MKKCECGSALQQINIITGVDVACGYTYQCVKCLKKYTEEKYAKLKDKEEVDQTSSNYDIMDYFEYSHLPEKLQSVSVLFCKLAEWIKTELPDNPETQMSLRKLLESKDCAVRASLPKKQP